MDWGFLHFLAQPWFVVSWYLVGAGGVLFLVRDFHSTNTPLKPAMKWAWPIVVFFFSVIGLALYFATARAPGIGSIQDPEEKRKAHHRYEQAMGRRVNGAVIHCVAGDGLGIMTGMVIARAANFSFWQEFWFEYLVGFVIGWLVFQRKSMTMMTDSIPKQLAMAFRGEFFSMLTVMGGMGAVMTYVTPMVATSQPKPLTSAFWGFGMLGLLVGFILTWPMNYMLVKIGWKHGMGGMEAAKEREVEGTPARIATLGTMSVLGAAALVLVAWLTNVRQGARPDVDSGEPAAARGGPGAALDVGLRGSVQTALDAIRREEWTDASLAMDAAHRAAEVGNHSAPAQFHAVLEEVGSARLRYQQGQEETAERHLERALELGRPSSTEIPPFMEPGRYRGATVIDAAGSVIGEVVGSTSDSLDLVLGGWRNAWGFVDFSGGRTVTAPLASLAFGAPNTVGMTLVMAPPQALSGASP